MPHKERFNATKKKKAASTNSLVKQPTNQLDLNRPAPARANRSVSRTDNAFAAILDASRRGVSTDAISTTFGDAFGRTRPKPVIGEPDSTGPLTGRFEPRKLAGKFSGFDDSAVPRRPVNPGSGVELGGPNTGGSGRRILPLVGLQAERRDRQFQVDADNRNRSRADQVRQPAGFGGRQAGGLSINAQRRARGAAAKARAEGRVDPSSVQRNQGPDSAGRLVSGAEQRRNARARQASQPNRERDLRRAFTKAGGQQAVDKAFRAAGGTKSFNARTGKRSVSIFNPGTGERSELGSIRVNIPQKNKRTSSSRASTAQQRARAQRNAGVSRRHARQLENRRRSEAAFRG